MSSSTAGSAAEPVRCSASTLVEVSDPESELAREEIFGPILALVGVPDLDSAIEFANGSRYGNAGSVFTTSGPSPAPIAGGSRPACSASTSGCRRRSPGSPLGLEGLDRRRPARQRAWTPSTSTPGRRSSPLLVGRVPSDGASPHLPDHAEVVVSGPAPHAHLNKRRPQHRRRINAGPGSPARQREGRPLRVERDGELPDRSLLGAEDQPSSGRLGELERLLEILDGGRPASGAARRRACRSPSPSGRAPSGQRWPSICQFQMFRRPIGLVTRPAEDLAVELRGGVRVAGEQVVPGPGADLVDEPRALVPGWRSEKTAPRCPGRPPSGRPSGEVERLRSARCRPPP